MMKNTISLTMIVRNEAENLRNCLDSISGQIEEIVIVDTGSTDGTREIAHRYTEKVYSYPWGGDFSAARNFALEKAKGDWVFYLDADEELIAGSGCLKDLVTPGERREAYLMPLDNPTGETTGECNRFLVLRFFKNNGRYKFQGKIHEQVIVPINGVVSIADGPVIRHKLLPVQERNKKRGRNLSLLKKACSVEPQNYFLYYYTGVEWLMLGKPALALPYFQQAYHNLTDENLLFRGPALRYLIICLKALGRLDEAICFSEEAILRYPEFTDVHYLCGVLYEEKREYQLAVKRLNQAVDCGIPPLLYSHMNGSGSFLAHYQLGCCYEALGLRDAAESHYRQALDANPGYVYPAYNLFMLIQAKQGPRRTLDYFKSKGYLADVVRALAVAGLFFTAGYPELACRTLESCRAEGARKEEYLFYLGKYSVYAGRLRQGLNYLNRVAVEGAFSVRSQVHRSVAFLLSGHFQAARAQALNLWKNQATRSHGLVLLKAARLMEKGEAVICPQKVRDVDLTGVTLEIIDRCSRYLPGSERGQVNPFLGKLVDSLEEVMQSFSFGACLPLLQNYQDKTTMLQGLFDYKFGPGVWS